MSPDMGADRVWGRAARGSMSSGARHTPHIPQISNGLRANFLGSALQRPRLLRRDQMVTKPVPLAPVPLVVGPARSRIDDTAKFRLAADLGPLEQCTRTAPVSPRCVVQGARCGALGVLLRSILVECDVLHHPQESVSRFTPVASGLIQAKVEAIRDDQIGREAELTPRPNVSRRTPIAVSVRSRLILRRSFGREPRQSNRKPNPRSKERTR